MELRDIIRIRREDLGLTLEDIAQACGVGRSIVAKWERGEVVNLKRNSLVALADVLQVSPLALLGREEPVLPPHGFDAMPDTVKLPRVGRIACGQPILAEQHVEAYDDVPASWRADFTLTCQGDSMAPRIEDGDVVAIRAQPMVEQGQIAAVRIGEEATLKAVYIYGDTLVLHPLNRAYADIVRPLNDMDGIAIEGLAVGFWHVLVQ